MFFWLENGYMFQLAGTLLFIVYNNAITLDQLRGLYPATG